MRGRANHFSTLGRPVEEKWRWADGSRPPSKRGLSLLVREVKGFLLPPSTPRTAHRGRAPHPNRTRPTPAVTSEPAYIAHASAGDGEQRSLAPPPRPCPLLPEDETWPTTPSQNNTHLGGRISPVKPRPLQPDAYERPTMTDSPRRFDCPPMTHGYNVPMWYQTMMWSYGPYGLPPPRLPPSSHTLPQWTGWPLMSVTRQQFLC